MGADPTTPHRPFLRVWTLAFWLLCAAFGFWAAVGLLVVERAGDPLLYWVLAGASGTAAMYVYAAYEDGR